MAAHPLSTDEAEVTTRLTLFGPPHIQQGGRLMTLPFERRSQLIVWLAIKGAWAPRHELVALLYPTHEGKLAYANLRKIVHRTHATPWSRALQAQGQALRFAAGSDLADFQAALAAGRIAEAVALRSGPFLAGFDDDANPAWTDWLQFERERLRLAWRAAALQLLSAGMEAPAAVDLSARLLAEDELDESALAAHLQGLAGSGQLAAAHQAFERHAQRLKLELGLEPSSALLALRAGLARAGKVDGATPTRAAMPTAAPEDASFVGRVNELRHLGTLLDRPDCALLCVVGPGGMGKTRLARRAMQLLAGRFADGAVFVALEGLPRGGDAAPLLAQAFGLVLEARTPAMQQVLRALADREALLVLDNFEHLADEAAWLDTLVQACPALKIVVTSRVRLVTARAWQLPLEGLPWPGPEDTDHFESFDAARLFLQAAQRHDPSLVLSRVPAAEAAAIVDICRQVEGLPLALEMAAAWTRLLSSQSIADELRRGTELLHSTDATRPARQASLEVVFEHSWQHLGVAEREALPRLAVFRGGFTASDARAVAGVALPVLVALADKSLLRKAGERCQLHPLVQQLAWERLQAVQQAEVVAAAHGRHYLQQLAKWHDPIRRAERDALRRIDEDFDNVVAAWQHAVRHGAAEDLVAATPSLAFYVDHRGRVAEGLALMREALDSPALVQDPPAWACIAARVARLSLGQDQVATAVPLAEQAMAITKRSGDLPTQQLCATLLGMCAIHQGRPDGDGWLDRAMELSRRSGDIRQLANALGNLALSAGMCNEFDRAITLRRQSLQLMRELGDPAAEAASLNNLGVNYMQRREFDAADAVLREALVLCRHHGLAGTRGRVLNNLGAVALQCGRYDEASALALQSLETGRATGAQNATLIGRGLLALAAIRRQDLPAATAAMAPALGAAVSLGSPGRVAEVLAAFAEWLALRGDKIAAARMAAYVLAQPVLPPDSRTETQALLRRWWPEGEPPAWAGPGLLELARRVLAEADIEYAPLRAELHRL